jgi:VWFA-related protein
MAGTSALAQQDAEVLRIDTRLVSLEVLVTDKRSGARVDSLKKENFELLDDGRPVSITHFSYGSKAEQPLAISLIVNSSPYRTTAIVPRLRGALEAAMGQLRPEDEVAVFDFSADSEMVQELTRDRDIILSALEKTVERQKHPFKSIGRNADVLSHLLLAAVNHTKERKPKSRIALIVISDDILGRLSPELKTDTENHLLAAGAAVNGLIKITGLLANALRPIVPTRQIAYYSEQTGGEMINVRGDDYSNALEQVIGNVVGRYSLGFEPDKSRLDGQFHKLTVNVKVPDVQGKKQKILIRARKSYFARKEER